MALESREVFPLIGWIFLAGIAFVIAAKMTGKVSEKIDAIFQ